MKQQKQNLEDATRSIVYDIMDAHSVGYNTARDLLRDALRSRTVDDAITKRVETMRRREVGAFGKQEAPHA